MASLVRRIFQAVTAASLLSWHVAGLAEPIRFAPLPMERPEEVVKQFKPMLTYLEGQLGTKIEITYSTSYAEILEKFRKGEVDLAYLGPLPYVALRKDFAQAEPVVHFLEKSGKATYTCALISAGEALPNKARDRRFALTQPLSTCGYLSTDDLVRKAGSTLEANRYRYLGKHDEVALAVARGDFDYGGMKTAIARNFAHLGITVLAETAPLPSFALIANHQSLSKERIEALRKLLMTSDSKTAKDWGDSLRNGAIPAADRDYDVVRQLRSLAKIPDKDKP